MKSTLICVEDRLNDFQNLWLLKYKKRLSELNGKRARLLHLENIYQYDPNSEYYRRILFAKKKLDAEFKKLEESLVKHNTGCNAVLERIAVN
jgi:hypothetical protein